MWPWRRGYWATLGAAVTAARARVDSRVPPDILLGTKRKGAVLKSWAKTRTDRRGKAMAADPARHCRFLLSLHPSYGDRLG